MGVNVAVVGATDDPTKYANQAMRMLEAHGDTVFPVNPTKETIDGAKVYPTLKDIPEKIDTVTLYVRAAVSEAMADDILALKPRRVIMNPGTVSDVLAAKLKANDIGVVHGCTLVMLQSGQF